MYFKTTAVAVTMFTALLLCACQQQSPVMALTTEVLSPMPEPHANNAIAVLEKEGRTYLYSFAGLAAGQTHADTSRSAFEYDVALDKWRKLPDLPVPEGRLASVAVGLYDRVFIFGGYSVAEDGSEISTPEVLEYNPFTEKYKRRADIPTPVDDTLAFTYNNRYIYLVSGWHNDGNVNLVQVLDTWEDRWSQATQYPGPPVFGHAGGIVGRSIVITGGVAVLGVDENDRRLFGASRAAWLGDISEDDPYSITWKKVQSPPSAHLYRMAAVGVKERGQIIFAGGGDNPYNFDGIGYDGVPANPTARVFAFDVTLEEWLFLGRRSESTMDHRALVKVGEWYHTVGGLDKEQQVSARLIRFKLKE